MKPRTKTQRAVALTPSNDAQLDAGRTPNLGTTYGKERLRFWLRLLRTTRSIEAELRERLRVEFDTTMPRFDVMAALARKPDGLTMTALSRTLLVSNGNATGIVDRLVADGLVVRMNSAADKRATFVRLTREGERRFAAMAAVHECWVDTLLGALDPRAMGVVSAHLERLPTQSRDLS